MMEMLTGRCRPREVRVFRVFVVKVTVAHRHVNAAFSVHGDLFPELAHVRSDYYGFFVLIFGPFLCYFVLFFLFFCLFLLFL